MSESGGEPGGSRQQLSPSHEADDVRQATKQTSVSPSPTMSMTTHPVF